MLDKGSLIWSGIGEKGVMRYNFSKDTLDGWQQIVKGDRLYNFWPRNRTCCFTQTPFPLMKSYFVNATLLHTDTAINTAFWVGSLNSPALLGGRQTWNILTNGSTGELLSYYALNVLPGLQSEILDRISKQDAPDMKAYDVPEYCIGRCTNTAIKVSTLLLN
jgi:hypothetical protein